MTSVLMLASDLGRLCSRTRLEAETLVKAGYNVVVMGWDRRNALDSTWLRDGVLYTGIRTLPFRYDYPRLRLFWREANCEATRHGTFDIVHCHDLDTLPIGMRLKQRQRCKLVYDAHDPWPLMMKELSRVPWTHNLWAKREQEWIRYVDLIIAASDGIFERLHLRYENAFLHVIFSTRPLERFVEPPSIGAGQPLRIGYVGSLARGRFLHELVRIVGDDTQHFRLKMYGSGPLKSEFPNSTEIPLNLVPEIVPQVLRNVHLSFCLLDPSKELFRIATPLKLFDALAVGRPTVATEDTWAGDFVEKYDCGVAVRYDWDHVRATLRELANAPLSIERMARNAHSAAKTRWNWDYDKENLLDAYSALEGL